MSTHETGEWLDLFDIALFEPHRGKLRKRIACARQAVNNRLDALITDQTEGAKTNSEHIALRDALATLAELDGLSTPGGQALARAVKLTGLPVKTGVADLWQSARVAREE